MCAIRRYVLRFNQGGECRNLGLLFPHKYFLNLSARDSIVLVFLNYGQFLKMPKVLPAYKHSYPREASITIGCSVVLVLSHS
jgi:hypothetical protein